VGFLSVLEFKEAKNKLSDVLVRRPLISATERELWTEPRHAYTQTHTK